MEPIKSIEYKCVNCGHEWTVNYPPQTVPDIEIKCPECNRINNNQKPYNYFRDGPRK
jgi:DNA-directed RNA polymerase subunit RPC12/RpoP